jgi:hypothetical protein
MNGVLIGFVSHRPRRVLVSVSSGLIAAALVGPKLFRCPELVYRKSEHNQR